MYFGRIIPFSADDENGNIALTCSSTNTINDPTGSNININSGNTGGLKTTQIEFNTDINDYSGESDKKYGKLSSKGMKDISMLRTYTGLPFQKHYTAFLGHSEVVNVANSNSDEFFSSSKWTDKYHASPAYVVHPHDGYRGYFENVIILDPENLLESDILREQVGEDVNHNPIYEEYKPIYLHQNNPNNFINNSSCNQNYIVAIRKI
jgi:hypothetical protein